MLEINEPAARAELEAVFAAYEQAFVSNNMTALDTFFLHDPTTIRYGVADMQLGIEQLRDYRRGVSPVAGHRLELFGGVFE